ncbi:MAG: hypothetical protein A3E37_00635 [Candidatus Andersenbacteria bacterium RIFCSPHIGHO2_12_FULL_46_9]|nr:MAG: hypothetical protein UW94_C0003G0057 [Parcubacteria group bacterium GW2011_GWA2_45_14]OGY33785.1 MAG: hypothetical protein A3B76_02900 [Candidatus Andersenbacteria bacterium RIFCSPHIGHO2_02_FULL_46_16]OGY35368.1 MAG: hypothetical protein A3E37_00635 [Candidatus Andersenbacteria bacterium RIFCSPHIGHO2_12_FULL_46_9]OGY36220.1 MAG: hypothetical protein A3I08_05220 [Candidatus Andersenbacteria bacterium RIFCSPLOWO2_02_FULL_46_11]OGY39863.1 MAG: hypothetical protein A3G57_00835 [Candidatus A
MTNKVNRNTKQEAEISVLGIVPAREGSKGIKHKNVTPLNGKPLLAYTLEAIQHARHKFDYIVSTDDEKIRNVALEYGGNVPYLRPKELARDDTNIRAVIEDILKKAEKTYDYILLLQPTTPLRISADIDAALNLAIKYRVNSVCSFARVESYHPWYMYYLADGDKLQQVVPTQAGKPRQEFPATLWRNGAIYLVKTEYLLKEKKFVSKDCRPYIMPLDRSVNIDSIDDLERAEYYLHKTQRQNLVFSNQKLGRRYL